MFKQLLVQLSKLTMASVALEMTHRKRLEAALAGAAAAGSSFPGLY